MDLVEAVYDATQSFPVDERYGLTSKLRRAAISVPSNIAEGHTRHHLAEYLHHLSIAQASLAEMDTQLEIARRLGYLVDENENQLRTSIESLGKQIRVLRQSLSKRNT